ncbi:MAG: SUMF1/EgtB/PvdO family nonheme iron enzyme, partial [Pseudomonadota bacterium]
AREDQAQADLLAERLGELGLTVWYDRRLGAGAEFDKEIERQLDAAQAVVVIWSVASVESFGVRSEAHEAANARKLVPIRIDQSRPPLLFRSFQYEDFSGWSGGAAEVCFQRLAIQVTALAKGQEAAAALPLDGETRPSAAPGLADRAAGPFRGLGSWLTLIAIVALFLANLLDVNFAAALSAFLGSGWGSLLAFAAFAIALFQFAERDLTADAKALAARWLRPEPDAKPIKAAQAFLTMFEAVFTKRHFSLACLWRSAVASILLYGALLLALVEWPLLEASATRMVEAGVGAVTGGSEAFNARKTIELNAALLFLAIPLTNIVVDFFSLWQTRLVLKLAAWRLPILLAVILDAILTGLVFIALLPLGPMLGIWAQGGLTAEAWEQALAFGPSIWEFGLTLLQGRPLGELQSVLDGDGAVSATSLFIAFVTTFTTSVWLWLALFFAPLFRLLSWSRGQGLSLVGRLFNVRARPIAALGYVTAVLIMVVGAAGAWAGQALRPAATGTFKDCAACPEMIAIPGGTFTMGSPESEPGRSGREGPQRAVSIQPFAIGVYEVTFREWDACVADGYCGGHRPDDEGWGRGRRPVIYVSWDDIAGETGFISWLNSKVAGDPYRLPSEAEWEYAARATTTGPYWTGETISTEQANFRPDDDVGYRAQTLPVGGQANAFGLYDVHGNVWEWVQDCWHGSYEGAPVDGDPWMDVNSGECSRAVIRGGSWSNDPRYLRSAVRSWDRRDIRFSDFGFRVARTHRGR